MIACVSDGEFGSASVCDFFPLFYLQNKLNSRKNVVEVETGFGFVFGFLIVI